MRTRLMHRFETLFVVLEPFAMRGDEIDLQRAHD